MDRLNRLSLVQFWLVVDGLRNPLEDDDPEDDIDHPHTPLTNCTPSDRHDIAQVYEAYFSKPELEIPERTKNDVRVFLKAGANATPKQYYKARSAVLRTQTAVLENMQNRDLPSFKKSDLYYKYLASDDLAAAASTSAGRVQPVMTRNATWIETPAKETPASPMLSSRHSFDGRRPSVTFESWDDSAMSSSIQNLDSQPIFSSPVRKPPPDNRVVETMEAILNDIVEEKPGPIDDFKLPPPISSSNAPLFGDSPRSSLDGSGTTPENGLMVTSSSREALFGLSGTGKKEKPKEGPPNLASLGLVNPYSRGEVFSDELFPDETPVPESEYEHDDNDDAPILPSSRRDRDEDDDDIHEAEPGDLGLSEAIAALTYDIERLSTQEVVVDSLTRKAELTNNISELRILRKSKASLQREIRRKELQKQQYIVQESDNSLYGRSSIRIQSSIVGKENGKEYALCTFLPRKLTGMD